MFFIFFQKYFKYQKHYIVILFFLFHMFVTLCFSSLRSKGKVILVDLRSTMLPLSIFYALRICKLISSPTFSKLNFSPESSRDLDILLIDSVRNEVG